MKSKPIPAAVFALLMLTQGTYAQDRQGRSSIETPNARPKENKPAQTGVKRVQDSTQSRTKKALGETAQRQGKTRADVTKVLKN